MKLTKLQLLNITTGHLHTSMDDIYDFFNKVVADGIMTHMIPRAFKAIKPIVEDKFPQLPHSGYHPNYEYGSDIVEISLTPEEQKQFWEAYSAQPNPLEGKKVIAVNL